jgi:hypothetical protein
MEYEKEPSKSAVRRKKTVYKKPSILQGQPISTANASSSLLPPESHQTTPSTLQDQQHHNNAYHFWSKS